MEFDARRVTAVHCSAAVPVPFFWNSPTKTLPTNLLVTFGFVFFQQKRWQNNCW
jgi:hypothetical protein